MKLVSTAIFHEEFTTTTYEEEDATMRRSEKVIEELTGQRIVGHRAPGGVIHDYSLRLFLEHGYIYSSNWRDSDGPFLHQIDGKTVPLAELPRIPFLMTLPMISIRIPRRSDTS